MLDLPEIKRIARSVAMVLLEVADILAYITEACRSAANVLSTLAGPGDDALLR